LLALPARRCVLRNDLFGRDGNSPGTCYHKILVTACFTLQETSSTMKSLRDLGWLTAALSLALVPACNNQQPALEKYGKYTLYGTRYDKTDNNTAKENAADMLTQMTNEPNVCLVGLWAYNPPAILNAVKQAKKEGKVHIVGFDEDELTLDGIKDGYIHGTIVQQPFEFGYQSVKLMAELARARDPKTAPLPAKTRSSAKKDEFWMIKDGILHIPYKVIKKDNVEEFHKLLREQKASGSAPAEAAGDDKRIKVGFVTNNAQEFWTIAEAGTRKAAKEFNVEVIFRRPKEAGAKDQMDIIKDLLEDKVQAIAISVIDPENQADFLNEVADKVPLITQDNDAPNTRRRCYIGTDNYEAGKAAGKLVKEAMPDGGAIGIFVGQPDPLNAKQRRQGVLDELAGEKDAKGK
jgi:ribose transport system substrate-binding protein